MTEQDGSERDELELEPEEVKDLEVDEAQSDEVIGGSSRTTKVDPTT